MMRKVHEWYQKHRLVKAVTTALESAALLAAPGCAANPFSNTPVPAAVRAVERSPIDISMDSRIVRRGVYNTQGFDRKNVDTRTRFNIGYKHSDALSGVIRLVGEGSTHPPFDHRFTKDHYEFHADRLYGNLKTGDRTELTAGAFPNPLTGLFDVDIPTVGGKLEYKDAGTELFDDASWLILYHTGQPWLNESNSEYVAFQWEGNKEINPAWSMNLKFNYVDYFGYMDRQFARTNRMIGGDYKSGFNIFNGGVRFVNNEVKASVFGSPLFIFANGMYNPGAKDENLGYFGGVGLGGLKKKGDAYICFEYFDVDADAAHAGNAQIITPFTNFTAPIFKGGYQLTDDLSLLGVFAFPTGKRDERGEWKYFLVGLVYKKAF